MVPPVVWGNRYIVQCFSVSVVQWLVKCRNDCFSCASCGAVGESASDPRKSSYTSLPRWAHEIRILDSSYYNIIAMPTLMLNNDPVYRGFRQSCNFVNAQ